MTGAKRLEKAAVAIFFAILTVIGLMTVTDYTGSYDELVQQNQLMVNLREYALLMQKAGIRWYIALNLDVPRIDDFVNRDYGMASMYVCAPFLGLMTHSQAFTSTLWGVVTWLWFMAGVASLYGLARELGMNRGLSCMAALLLYLSPQMFAHAHFNDKDIIVLSLVLLCLWLGARFLRSMTWREGLLFSLSGALAMNLRVVGLLPWGVIGLCAVLKLTLNREWSARRMALAAGVIAALPVFYFLLTPSVWSDPVGFFRYQLSNAAEFSRWEGRLFFRGASFQIPENTLPFYYIFYMMIVSLPVFTVALTALGQLGMLIGFVKSRGKCLKNNEGLLLLAATLCWVAPVGAYAVMRPIVYNGWRHFYFAYAGAALLAAYGIELLWKLCSGKVWLRRGCALALSLCFGVTAVGMAVNHPHQLSYYNVLAGNSLMETDYWNTSGTYALERLIECEERNKDLPLEVGCYFFDIQNARFKMNEEQKAALTTTVKKDSPYLYYIENYVHVYDVPVPEGYHVLFTVDSYGRRIGTMYERSE